MVSKKKSDTAKKDDKSMCGVQQSFTDLELLVAADTAVVPGVMLSCLALGLRVGLHSDHLISHGLLRFLLCKSVKQKNTGVFLKPRFTWFRLRLQAPCVDVCAIRTAPKCRLGLSCIHSA